MLEMIRAIIARIRRQEPLPPPCIVTRWNGDQYPLTVVDGQWVIHSETGTEVVHGLAHAARIAGNWARAGVRPPEWKP